METYVVIFIFISVFVVFFIVFVDSSDCPVVRSEYPHQQYHVDPSREVVFQRPSSLILEGQTGEEADIATSTLASSHENDNNEAIIYLLPLTKSIEGGG